MAVIAAKAGIQSSLILMNRIHTDAGMAEKPTDRSIDPGRFRSPRPALIRSLPEPHGVTADFASVSVNPWR